jgi:peptide deformylase
MIKFIIQAPDDRLGIVATPFPDQLEDLHKDILIDLLETFKATHNCIGLAANQLGHPWRAIITDITPGRGETCIMVNPVITKASEAQQRVNDGCMSVKRGIRNGYTYRPKRITVEWVDVAGDKHRWKFSGLAAAAIHHEVDHLNGVLFLARLIDNPVVFNENS